MESGGFLKSSVLSRNQQYGTPLPEGVRVGLFNPILVRHGFSSAREVYNAYRAAAGKKSRSPFERSPRESRS